MPALATHLPTTCPHCGRDVYVRQTEAFGRYHVFDHDNTPHYLTCDAVKRDAELDRKISGMVPNAREARRFS